MSKSSSPNLIEQLRRVLKDAIDYFESVIQLIQARFAELALSSVVFLLLMGFAFLLFIAGFLMLNIAFGVWLTHTLGSVGFAVLLLGVLYFFLGLLATSVAMRWLNKLKS